MTLISKMNEFATKLFISQQKRYERCLAFVRKHPILLVPYVAEILVFYVAVRIFSLFETKEPKRDPAVDRANAGHGEPASAGNIRDLSYSRWASKYGTRPADVARIAESARALRSRPLISVVMPVFNPPIDFLRQAIASVTDQAYDNWELCIADDASGDPEVKKTLDQCSLADPRIKVVYRENTGHISAATNSALKIAHGEIVAFMDHDDMLSPDALYEIALLLNKNPDADVIYSDEDKVADQNILYCPYFKPDWCPDSLLSRMYLGHLMAYRRDLLEKLEGLRTGFEGSQDYDLALRAVELTDRIFHIPRVLYHWRVHGKSSASSTAAKPYAYEAALKAINEALNRRGEPLEACHVPGYKGHYRLVPRMKDRPSARIIIPTRDNAKRLGCCLKSIFSRSTYANYSVTVVDNGSRLRDTSALIALYERQEPRRFSCVRMDIPFNFSRINNRAVNATDGECIIFLNDDTEVITPEWIEYLACHAMRDGAGAVGCKLLYPNGTIQHAGVIMGLGGIAGHGHKHMPENQPGYFGHMVSLSNMSAVTAACMACSRRVFQEAGGFDESLAVEFNDVDICLRLMHAGRRNIFVPDVKLTHHESSTRSIDLSGEKLTRHIAETGIIAGRWPEFLAHDPCYSDHLTRDSEQYGLRE